MPRLRLHCSLNKVMENTGAHKENAPHEQMAWAVIQSFEKLREGLIRAMGESNTPALSRVIREDKDDTVYSIDLIAAELLWTLLEEHIAPLGGAVLIAEGVGERIIEPAGGGAPRWRMLVDPVDGTRCLMYGKRSAWALAAIAPDKGDGTMLSDSVASVMVELPTPRAALAETLWAVKGSGARAETVNIITGDRVEYTPRPSKAAGILDGYAMISRFFPGGKDIIAAVEENFMERVIGPPRRGKATVFEDQYISTGGQMAELVLGRDRFCADIRKTVYDKLEKERGLEPGHCCRPYDAAGLLVASEAGIIITDPAGNPLDAPFDTSTDLDWAGYANEELKTNLERPFQESLKAFGLI